MKNTFRLLFAILFMVISANIILSCSDDSEESLDNSNNLGIIFVDDKRYYCSDMSIVTQTNQSGMRLYIHIKEKNYDLGGNYINLIIWPSKVADLKKGDIIDTNNIEIKGFFKPTTVYTGNYFYITDGSITIKEIKDTEIIVQLNDIKIEHSKDATIHHTIKGTATLFNHIRDGATGNIIPFSKEEIRY